MNIAMRLVMGVLGVMAVCGTAQAERASRKAPFRVVVWDERQPAQKQVYENFLGNHIADYLRQQAVSRSGAEPDYTVKSVGMDDP